MTISRVDSAQAQAVLERATAAAEAMGLPMCLAIVDVAGYPVELRRMPGAGWATVDLAIGKARAAVAFGASTAELAERWAGAALFTTALIAQTAGTLVPAPGGVLLTVEGEVVGALGASGGTGAQDAEVVAAGLAGL